jgi:ketosteroid isomerase-like protein
MDDDVKVLERIYDRFNARDIDGVLTALTDDVVWANGMDGGHVHGREAVRAYWTRQWTMVSPHVEPVGFHRTQDGAIIAEVRQSVRDLEGKPLEGQTHGLKDKTVEHIFRLREGKVARFDIQDLPDPCARSPRVGECDRFRADCNSVESGAVGAVHSPSVDGLSRLQGPGRPNAICAWRSPTSDEIAHSAVLLTR